MRTLAQLAAGAVELTMTSAACSGWPVATAIRVVAPHRHALLLGATAQAVQRTSKRRSARRWALRRPGVTLPFDERAAVFLRAADLLSLRPGVTR